jgi:hypothetical protein
MEGIHIFNKTQIIESINTPIIIFLFFGIVFTVSIGIMLIENHKAFDGCMLILLGLILFAMMFNIPTIKNTGKCEYAVSISKDVNLLEFNKKYAIERKEGELYIIKDK